MAKAATRRAAGSAKSSARGTASVRGKASAGERAARAEVIAVALRMSQLGLSPGRSGNVSRRWQDGMLITPSGLAYEGLAPDDIVFVDADGGVAAGQCKPSSEWQFHLSAYNRRGDMHAIVHTHSLHAVVLACRHEPIPAFHYMVAIAGGKDIPCVPYATFGTRELADHVADGLTNRNACLMANHGQIAMGAKLEGALDLACEVELLAEQYCKVLMLGGPKLLADGEMSVVLERFKGYGQNAQSK